jgi:hypothetical protein
VSDRPPRIPLPPPLRRALAVALLALVVAALVRHRLIEPAAIAHLCDPDPWRGACAFRSALIRLFVNQEIGALALVAGVIATFGRSARWATLGLSAGAAGLVLYSYEPAAVGALLSVLVLARSQPLQASTRSSPA